MVQTDAPVLQRETLAGGWQRTWLHLPALATQGRPGQLLAARPAQPSFDPLIRTPLPLLDAVPATGAVSILHAPWDQASIGLTAAERVDVLGPVGRGWQLHEQTRNVLLVGGLGAIAPLLFLVSVALQRGCSVVLLAGSSDAAFGLPPALVPAAVEYQFAHAADEATAALDLIDDAAVRWADALYTTLPMTSLPALVEHVRRTRMRWQAGFAHGWLLPPMACFVGICDVCLVPEARHTWRACTDGPQCDVRDFVR